MKNNTNLPTLMVGPADKALQSRRDVYLTPKITMVEFKVEVGVDGSVTKVSSWGETWSAATGDSRYGTEQYESNTTQGTGFFGDPITGE